MWSVWCQGNCSVWQTAYHMKVGMKVLCTKTEIASLRIFILYFHFMKAVNRSFKLVVQEKLFNFVKAFALSLVLERSIRQRRTKYGETNIWRAQRTWKQTFHRKCAVTISTYITISIHIICGKVNSSKKCFKTNRNQPFYDIVDQTYHWKNWELQPALIKL